MKIDMMGDGKNNNMLEPEVHRTLVIWEVDLIPWRLPQG